MAQLDFSVSVFQRQSNNFSQWWSLGFGAREVYVGGRTSSKLRDRFIAECRERVRRALPAELPALKLVRGRRLHHVQLDLSVRTDDARTRFARRVPVIVEPRPLGPTRTLDIAYHPMRPHEWFPLNERYSLQELANAVFQRRWSAAGLEPEQLEQLVRRGDETLKIIAFRAEPKSLLSQLAKQKGPEMAQIGTRRRRPGTTLLSELGFDLTRKAVDDELSPGMVRAPYREQLRQLLCGSRKAPVLLIGPPGVGKTTLLHRMIVDLLEADGWAAHQNLDRVHHVWQISGRRIIAGMSYLGQWEQRCIELLEETYAKRIVLWAEDLHAWGRIGESRQSDRSLTAFFRGPVARGELTLIAECTTAQYQQLQADASGFANLFTTIHVEPTDAGTTMRMLVHEARKLELALGCGFDPRVYRSIYELSGSLYSGTAYPGKALELVRALGARHRTSRERAAKMQLAEILMHQASGDAGGGGEDTGRPKVGTPELIELLSERTGMPALLLAPDVPLEADAVASSFAAQVIGQPQAVAVVRDLIVRIKAGLCDPGRPYGVFLFTGPTGTGKTEMAKALAEYLFGDESRLVRLDMSEYNVPGAAARLIGDRFQPSGVLTSRVRAQPFCVVLLDEVEKADPSVLNLMLQLFDDGRLSDASGDVADFRHAVVIMTSNLGAGGSSSMGFGGDDRRAIMLDIAKAVREFFPPELFNRIDRVVEFRPLDEPAARIIARKELARLLGRRGLAERNSFVRTTEAVLAKIVREGFNARDGARSLKRWLEDNLGSLLVDTLTRSRAASMRLLWIYEPRGEPRDQARAALQVHEEALREADPIPEDSRLGELLEQPNAALLEQVPAALAFLRGLERSPRLEQLSKTLATLLEAYNRHAADEGQDSAPTHQTEALYNLEILRSEIHGLREALELHATYDQRLSGQVEEREGPHEGLGEQLEIDRFSQEQMRVRTFGGGSQPSVRRFDRRQFNPSLPLRERQAMLRAIAEVWFLERALERARDPRQHVVFLELSRISDPRRSGRFAADQTGLFAELAHAYRSRGRGELEACAGLRRGGGIDDVVSVRIRDPELGRELFEQLCADDPELLVLQLVGPSVREFFAGESGCQVLETLGGGHEIVRVRVLDGEPSDEPAQLITRTLAQRQAFIEALEAGTELPPNPDAMLPIIRRFRLEEARPGRPASVEVEDYPLSHVSSHSLPGPGGRAQRGSLGDDKDSLPGPGGPSEARGAGRKPESGDDEPHRAQLEPVLALLWLMRVGVAIGEDRERRNTDAGLGPGGDS
ncbi:ATP-dependent Clp protease ATP-binding subunit ClpE [Enhygromyxa salina]|uniref:ATP-dependent Clp protease ATP-binding subunit ClpE n=1 Tax=Enhygromyxa salina TaxID=215803 RepID=A0A2S9XH54_9BACT|nr:AAA family ATPase [Enhygromyxa salina]PRP92193.1 ATP-dependent Clp protease ATP-binding subunit ClpE [Enhygromyxa salina]